MMLSLKAGFALVVLFTGFIRLISKMAGIDGMREEYERRTGETLPELNTAGCLNRN